MFARDFVRVDRPFETVAPRFAGDPSWLEPLVDTALRSATVVRKPGSGGRAAEANRARCSQGPLRVREGTLVVPWTWTFDQDPYSLSPVESDLTVAPVNTRRCALTLEARVKPPAGALPTEVQHSLDEVLRAFLHGLAASIVAPDVMGAREERRPT